MVIDSPTAGMMTSMMDPEVYSVKASWTKAFCSRLWASERADGGAGAWRRGPRTKSGGHGRRCGPGTCRHRSTRPCSAAPHFRNFDPFPHVPCALLSNDHIKDYVRVTAMLCPFFPTDERLKKPASYEAWPKRFIRWDKSGKKLIDDIDKGDYERHGYELKENSITFVQIEFKNSVAQLYCLAI